MRSLPVAAMLVLAAPALAQESGLLDIRAQLSPRRYTTLSAELGAKIERLPIKEGERFREGQILVSMECSVHRANLEKARAALVAAEKTSAVNKKLHEMNAGGALEAEVAAAEAQKARAEVEAGRAVLAKCQVAAPFPGRVAELKVREQQFVQPGNPMMEIIDDSVLEVEFLAPSKWLSWMKPGSPFQIAVDETGRTYPAKVARLGARVDPVSQSVKVVGEITGTHAELLAGMSGKIQMAPGAP
ncbi:MAG: efflux RND transporter periplasmic adaptor subunit [Magnetospirillum sp.]|nr:efflux RND transporter periplasmic adaptor subunit [Magnetospirillum sp.]